MNKFIKKIICSIALAIYVFNIGINQSYIHASGVPTVTIDKDSGKTSLLDENGQKLKEKEAVFDDTLEEVREVIAFLSGIGMLSCIAIFILNFINLGNSKGNPEARKKAIDGLIICGIATAGLGSVTLISKLFYNMAILTTD